MELSKKYKIKKILFASSSSVYGSIKSKKFSENLKVDEQISLYAATKKTNEILANYYANSFGITILGMRFFYSVWRTWKARYVIFQILRFTQKK